MHQLSIGDKEGALIFNVKWKKQSADIVYNMLYYVLCKRIYTGSGAKHPSFITKSQTCNSVK